MLPLLRPETARGADATKALTMSGSQKAFCMCAGDVRALPVQQVLQGVPAQVCAVPPVPPAAEHQASLRRATASSALLSNSWLSC